MANLFTPGIPRIVNELGAPVSGAKVYFYLTGTLTLAPIYTTSAGDVPLANPVVADSAGILPNVYLDPATTYRVRWRKADDSALRADIDPLRGFDEVDAPTGPQGLTGPAGATGATGATGAKGDTGSAGTSGNTYTAAGGPSDNVGIPGDEFLDTLNQVFYPQKMGSTWGPGFKYTTSVAASPLIWYDMSAAALPSYMTYVRAGTSTDAFYDDTPGRTYNTISANTPVFRDGKLWKGGYSTNYFINSTAPVTQTITLPANKYSFYGNGTGTITVALGTATGTVPTAGLALSSRSYQTFQITGGGTVVVTVTGSVNWVMVAADSVTTGGNPPRGPLIVTAGAAASRPADEFEGVGALKTMLRSGTGTFMLEVSELGLSSAGSGSNFISQSNNALLGYDGTNGLVWDGAAYFVNFGIGDALIRGIPRSRYGFAFSPSGISTGGGTKVPITTTSTTWPAPSSSSGSVVIGGSSSAFDGSALNGWITRIGYSTARLTDAQLQAELNGGTFALDTSTVALPIWEAAKRTLKLGTSTGTYLLCYGTSHFAGTNPTGNVKPSSVPSQLAARLVENGYQAASDSNFGFVSVTAGVNSYDPSVTLSSGISLYGGTLNGSGLRLTGAAQSIDKTVARVTDTFTVYAQRSVGTTGQPQFTVSLTGGGSATTFTMVNNANIQTFQITVPRAANNSYRIAWNALDVTILGWSPSDTLIPAIQVANGGLSGNTAQNLNNSDILALITVLAPSLTIYGCITNDWANLTGISTLKTYTDANLAALKASGDVVMITEPPSATAFGTTALQGQYTSQAIACANAAGVKTIDLFNAMKGGYSAWNKNGFYFDTIHLNYSWGYPMVVNLIDQKINLK